MKIDLSGIPLIDNHAHPFPGGRASQTTYERNFTLSLTPKNPVDIRSTLLFEMLNRRLRKVLDLPENCSIEEIKATRNRLLEENRKAYIDMLWKDAGYAGMIADVGSPVTKNLLTKEEMDEFERDLDGYFMQKVNRLEWVAEDVIESGTHSFEEFTQMYVDGLKKMAREQKLVGLKSIIAYKTGLEVRVLSEAQFREAYYLYLSDTANRDYEKVFRDYCFCKGCEVAAELDLPLQIHTALGDSPMLNLHKCDPLHLYDAINAYPDTKFVLIHAGYPYCEELGFLMAHYDNVYGDVSSMVPFASIAGETKIRSIMEMAPMTKLMFGTDAGGVPEQFWYGGILFRTFFTNILQDLVDRDYISYSYAMETAENVMYKNIKRLYKVQ